MRRQPPSNIHIPDSNKKFQMINDCAEKFDIPILGIDVQPPQAFHDLSLYYNYLIKRVKAPKNDTRTSIILIIYFVFLFFVSFL